MTYDIIGDIHGQADKLHSLLAHMGYEDRAGAYRHSGVERRERQLEVMSQWN